MLTPSEVTPPVLRQGDCAKVSSINDKTDWKTLRKALDVIDFSESSMEVRSHHSRLYVSKMNTCMAIQQIMDGWLNG